jgi:hypothetical protein
VGSGDQANARSSLSGKGVFKSTDAGKTWQPMGLPDSQHIARIVIDPKNPDTVLVAAMGHLFSKNDERGVFKTTDGGQHWKKVLYINDAVGAIDLVLNRKTPTTLYAAMYDKDRRPWQIVESGPESGVFKSEDGGEKWTKLGGGLPTGKIGRIGLDLYQKNPQILYALLENQNPASGAPDQPGRGTGRGATGGARWCSGCRARAGGGGRGARSPAGHHRQRAVSQRRWREDVDEDVADERRGRQGALLVQPDQDRSEQRSGRHRKQRQHVHHARRRQDLADRVLPRRVRRLPLHVVGSG